MGVLTDMLPEVQARSRLTAIMDYLGCTRLECTIEQVNDAARMGQWVHHNEKTAFFEDRIGAYMRPVFRGRELAPVTYIPNDIAEWIESLHTDIESLHTDIEACREAARQDAIDADVWLQHAEMVSLS